MATSQAKQVEFARTIHGAGTDLLNLISDILDLSKIESGTVTVDAEEIYFANLLETVARPFRHQADSQGLSFDVQANSGLDRSFVTDPKRLQQILKNLLSNAMKFTAEGSVRLRVMRVTGGWRPDNTAAQSGKFGRRFRGHRHRRRHSCRKAEDRVRGFSTG